MKKTMKKFAAIIAAMMTVSVFSSMSAFATENPITLTNDNDEKSARIDLTVTNDLVTSNVYQSSPTWNVEVLQQEGLLSWSLTGTQINTYTLTWDPSTKSYTSGAAAVSYSDGTGTFEGKTVTITNNSNFAVSANATVTTGFALDNDSINSIAAAGGTGSFTITPNSNLTTETTGTATFTFVKNSGLVQYNSNNVTDTSGS